jgi:hypothetical protein
MWMAREVYIPAHLRAGTLGADHLDLTAHFRDFSMNPVVGIRLALAHAMQHGAVFRVESAHAPTIPMTGGTL